MRTWKTWCCGVALAMLAACGGGGGGDSSAGPAAGPPAATASLDVTVYDNVGRFVSDATVSTGAAQATTDANGHATIAVATGVEQALTIDKGGFAEQVKVVNLPADATAGSLRAMVIPRQPAATIAAIENGGTATGRHGVSVTFPAGALVDGAGRAVTGPVDLLMTPVDVTDVDVEAFPGLFEGIPTGAARTGIVSYGTSELVPVQGGARLALAVGQTAQIELPVYVTKRADGSTVNAGDTIALWSLDTTTGLWKQEGSGTVVTNAASPTGLALRATIAHFSWWNADAVSVRATVDLTVTADSPNVPADTVAPVDATVVAGTGPASTATTSVTVGTATTLAVPTGATVRFRTRFNLPTQSCTGAVDVATPAAGGSVSATLRATCIDVPVPTIVRPAELSATNSASDTTVDIDISGPMPDSVELQVDGTTVAQMPAQFFYRTFWRSADFGEGTHTLAAVATKNGVSRSSALVDVVVDRTPPQITAVAPAPGSDVDTTTVFTVDFDEPVNALPFGLAQAVRLTVTPTGQNVPVDVPADVVLDAAGLRLTVTPQAQGLLPLGTIGLSWGALQDAAGNAITGTLAATYPVSRQQRLAADLAAGFDTRVGIAVDDAGTVHVLRRRPDDNLEVSQVVGGGFVPLGPVVNDRQAGSFALAIRGNQTLVAFEQRDAAGTGAEVMVRRFDAASSTWQTVGARAFPVARPVTSNSIRPQVAIDPAGRVVLAFIGSAGNLFGMEAWRFDGNAWTSIGGFSNIIELFDLKVDANGTPYMAYLEGTFGSNAARLGVLRNTGAAWAAVGPLVDSTPDATQGISEPVLAVDAAGNPWVAWFRTALPGRTRSNLVRFDGTAFVPVALPDDEALAFPTALTLLHDEPVIAGLDSFRRIAVRRMHGGQWEDPIFVAPPGGDEFTLLTPSGNDVLLGVEGSQIVRVTRLFFP